MSPEVAYAGLLETSAAVGQVILIAMLLERALAFVFEYHWMAKLNEKVEGLKAPIAFGLSLLVVRQAQLDILAELFREEGAPVVVTWIGSVITALIIAGGSAGAMALFQNWFNWSRDARRANTAAKQQEAKARESVAAGNLAEAKIRELSKKAEFVEIRKRVGETVGPATLKELES